MTVMAPPMSGLPRVNLMPRPEVIRRERDKLVRIWLWIALAAILVAALIIAGAFAFKLFADQRLAAEQARTNALLTEIAALSEVSQALSAESELTDFRAEAMATDFAWEPVISKITGVLPPDSSLTGFDLTVGGVPQGDDPTIVEGLVGTVSVDSPTPLDIVAIIRSLRGVEGVLSADGQSVTTSQVSEGRFAYLLSVQFDQSLYSGEYAPQEGGN
jgi:hypothetical protein